MARFARQTAYEKLRRAGCHVPRWRGVERARDGADCAVCGDRAGSAGRQSPFLRTSFIINRCDVEGGKRRAAGLFVVHRWLLLLL
jgi:hypothetical protein